MRVAELQQLLLLFWKEFALVAEWLHFTLFLDKITHYKLKVYTFWGL